MDTTAGPDAWCHWGTNLGLLVTENFAHYSASPVLHAAKKTKNLYHMDFCASCVFHTNVLLPSFLFHPPSGRVVVRRGFVASSSRAWCWITWLPPTTLALPSCHQGNVSILTNMPWHLWPSSPICDPISFSHFISPLLYWDSDCSHYYFIFSDHHHLFLPNQFVMPCVPW